MNADDLIKLIQQLGLPIVMLAGAIWWIRQDKVRAEAQEEKRQAESAAREQAREVVNNARELAWREERRADRVEYIAALDKVTARLDRMSDAMELRGQLDPRPRAAAR